MKAPSPTGREDYSAGELAEQRGVLARGARGCAASAASGSATRGSPRPRAPRRSRGASGSARTAAPPPRARAARAARRPAGTSSGPPRARPGAPGRARGRAASSVSMSSTPARRPSMASDDSEVRSDLRISYSLSRSSETRHVHHVGELLARRTAPVRAREGLLRLREVTLQAAQRARRPVAAPQLVEDRSVDARPEIRLQARALRRVVAVDRADQALDAARDQVVDLARRRQLADLLVDDVLDERHVGQHQPVRSRRHRSPCTPARAPPTSWSRIGIPGGRHDPPFVVTAHPGDRASSDRRNPR